MAKKEAQLIKEEELKAEILSIKNLLPENWKQIYIEKFCPNLRGMAVLRKYNTLCLFGKQHQRTDGSLIWYPTSSEMKNLRKLLEMESITTDKSKQLQAS